MNKDTVTMRTYGGITLTHYSSSGRISVKVTAENAVMDGSQMLGFLWAAGRLQPELASAWDEGWDSAVKGFDLPDSEPGSLDVNPYRAEAYRQERGE